MNSKFLGTGVALITPFKSNLSVDHEALTNIVDFNIDNGTDYLVISGTTAESATITKQEKKDIVIKVNEHLDNRIKSLHAMLNRTDALLFNHRSGNQDDSDENSLRNHNKEIIKLAREGFDSDYIADSLFISKEEVMLVLDLKKKISKKDRKEDIS